jgi:subtilisin family serine protease
MFLKHAAKILGLLLLIAGSLGAAQARRPEPRAHDASSRGVIILPGAQASALAQLQAGDTPVLAGTRVKIEMTDPEVGLLVSSAALSDVDLAQALSGAGIAAEVNHPRHILPITPTAELFSTPLATRPEDLPNKPDFWHVEQVGADLVHHSGITGTAALIVGVIDTGVYTNHPMIGNVLLPGYDFVNDDPEADDDVGHGTHVAGIVHSICPRCSILPVKVLDYYGGDDYTIARGIRYARQRGARIIQISLGGPAPSTTMCQAVRAVEAQGAQVVIAAGNSAGSDTAAIGYPALCSPASLVVSATDRYDIPAWFSNYGPAIDLAAPGLAVWSTIPPSEDDEDGLIPASGTSMAAPQVSGGAALLWSQHMNWTAAQIRDRLIVTARNISVLPGIDDGYGPRLDVAQAFGLRSRPIVVGMTVDKPWVPREGSDQARTVQVRAHVRGDAITAVRLAVTINGATQQYSMTLQSGDIYGLNYLVPKNTAHRREILLQVVAANSAGPTYGGPEIVAQDGGPIPPATIRIVNGAARRGKPVEFMVEWFGSWNNFDFDCGDYSPTQYYNPRGQTVTCTYQLEGAYQVRAALYNQNTFKGYADLQIVVRPPYEVFLPQVRS